MLAASVRPRGGRDPAEVGGVLRKVFVHVGLLRARKYSQLKVRIVHQARTFQALDAAVAVEDEDRAQEAILPRFDHRLRRRRPLDAAPDAVRAGGQFRDPAPRRHRAVLLQAAIIRLVFVVDGDGARPGIGPRDDRLQVLGVERAAVATGDPSGGQKVGHPVRLPRGKLGAGPYRDDQLGRALVRVRFAGFAEFGVDDAQGVVLQLGGTTMVFGLMPAAASWRCARRCN